MKCSRYNECEDDVVSIQYAKGPVIALCPFFFPGPVLFLRQSLCPGGSLKGKVVPGLDIIECWSVVVAGQTSSKEIYDSTRQKVDKSCSQKVVTYIQHILCHWKLKQHVILMYSLLCLFPSICHCTFSFLVWKGMWVGWIFALSGGLTKVTISAHNEQVFSVMQSSWIRKRNRLSAQSMKGTVTLQCKFKNMSCGQFHAYVHGIPELLKKISPTDKYVWP
jgi:hypothetical protein